MIPEDRIQEQLTALYKEKSEGIYARLIERLEDFEERNPQLAGDESELTQEDAILITYGDQFAIPGESPLQTLAEFLEQRLKDLISSLHILPFYPYSSDDGFSVVDYRQVDPRLGTWKDIDRLAGNFRLMFDAVINHISRQSPWFKAFLNEEEPYRDYFITLAPETDLRSIFRPRANLLLTPVETASGISHVWTTFSADQIDLNFANPNVMLEVIDVLLFYVEKGARLIRLDAIGYVWKQLGTSSLNLAQAHRIVKLFRAVLDLVAPRVALITETNVPHAENIAYFGQPLDENNDGKRIRGDEAQIIYNFSLAPLILHSFLKRDANVLSKWVESLAVPYPTATFFNFIASHDGIGVMPASGLLSELEIQDLVECTLRHGGQVSYKSNSDGSKSVYELNITLYDALNDPDQPDQSLDVRRFLASQAIMLSLAGVPGIYAHSLFGSRNCHPCVKKSGQLRSINREKLIVSSLEIKLADPTSIQAMVFNGYTQLLRIRRRHPAFHPEASQKILFIDNRLFCLRRTSTDSTETIFCLINVSPDPANVKFYREIHEFRQAKCWIDEIGDRVYMSPHGELDLTVEGYQSLWLLPDQ